MRTREEVRARVWASASARLSIAQAQVEAAERATARIGEVEEAFRAARRNITRDDFAGWRRVVEVLFTSPGCSITVMPSGEVKMDGLLPVVHPSSDTTSTSCSRTCRGACRTSCAT